LGILLRSSTRAAGLEGLHPYSDKQLGGYLRGRETY